MEALLPPLLRCPSQCLGNFFQNSIMWITHWGGVSSRDVRRAGRGWILRGRGWRPGPGPGGGRDCGWCSLTHKHRDQEPADSLLLDLLDLGCSSWGAGLAHDGEGIGMGDRSHGGGTEPGHSKESGDPAHANDQQQVQVEAGALDQLALWFADNQPGGVGGQG